MGSAGDDNQVFHYYNSPEKKPELINDFAKGLKI
jgi:hypothetical protein